MSKLPLLSVTLLLAVVSPGWGQQEEPLRLPRLTAPIVLDGLSDEPAWAAIAPLPLVMMEPLFGEIPSERTEIRVAYDDDYIYASIRAYDRDPAGIRINSLYRDRVTGDDLFVLFLDTFNDNENGVSFTTTPAGVRRDAAISNDASGSNSLNADYNTFWDVKTVVNEAGWFAEARIPFASLRFQDQDGRVVMGLIATRMISRKNERVTFPSVSPSVQRAWVKPSLARKVVLEGVYARKPLHVTTFGVGGFDQSLRENGGTILRGEKVNREVGLDLKYGITTNLTLDLTVNTDFAQVEADDQQVNLTRFSLFFPEKREFFQERASIFDFRTGRGSRLFHSRRIGLSDTGEPVRILGGARMIGRIGAWDIGLLDMQTAAGATVASENFGVVRLRRQLFNPYSYAGAMVTSRVGETGGRNLAYGLDGVFRLLADDYLTILWAQSHDAGLADAGVRTGLNAGRFTLDLERRRRRGFGYRSGLSWSGADYNPGVGFSRRNDFTLLGQNLSYTWLQGAGSPLIWHSLDLEGELFLRNADRSAESVEVGPGWSFAQKNGATGSIEAKLLREDLLSPFHLSATAVVPAGEYLFHQALAKYEMSRSRRLRTQAGIMGGTFYDGWRMSADLGPTWNVSRHLELGGTYLYNHVRFPDREQRFDAHILRLRAGAAMNTSVSLHSLLQMNSSTQTASANFRFRYSFKEGNDLWIVYNEGLDMERYRLHPSLRSTESRAVVMKYTHTFHPKLRGLAGGPVLPAS
jgi:hypothetical protein